MDQYEQAEISLGGMRRDVRSRNLAEAPIFGLRQSDGPFRPHVTLARLGDDGRKIARKYPIDCPVSLKQKVSQSNSFGRRRNRVGVTKFSLRFLCVRRRHPWMASSLKSRVTSGRRNIASPNQEPKKFQSATVGVAWRAPWPRLSRATRANGSSGFFHFCKDFKFLPGGRIQAGAGTGRNVTLFNCFVMGTIEDSIPGIFAALQESATTMQQGGGIGCDFSTFRPRGTRARGVGSIASGPVSFMRVWDSMCATILSTGARRGAMMATLRCDHPDIEEFVVAKQAAGALRHFNLSVLITDEFMAAVRADAPWPLLFPAASSEADGPLISRSWSATHGAVPCRIIRQVSARTLWQKILTRRL